MKVWRETVVSDGGCWGGLLAPASGLHLHSRVLQGQGWEVAGTSLHTQDLLNDRLVHRWLSLVCGTSVCHMSTKATFTQGALSNVADRMTRLD